MHKPNTSHFPVFFSWQNASAVLFFSVSTIFLTFSLYNNRWNVVEPAYYLRWEKTYERVVVARLAKSQQDGILSAGALLGLANTPEGWNFEVDQQYEIYETGQAVEDYLAYESHPGLQGTVFSVFDKVTHFSPQQNILFMRLSVSLLSALVLSLFCTWLLMEFGWLPAILVMLFSVSSEWMILPAMNSYWNLWAFYLPFVAGLFLLDKMAGINSYQPAKIYAVMFLVMLVKVLVTGFEMITTVLIMATVPFLYYAITRQWGWKSFLVRTSILGIILAAATAAGLAVLVLQISLEEGSIKTSVSHIIDRLDRRSLGNPDDYRGVIAESLRADTLTVLKTYLQINAFNTQTPPRLWQVPYWILILVFAVFTGLFLINNKYRHKAAIPVKGLALTATVWYSLAAPLSWYVIFKPTSYIHTFLFPMAWQMPFILMGLALCGYVVQDLFNTKRT